MNQVKFPTYTTMTDTRCTTPPKETATILIKEVPVLVEVELPEEENENGFHDTNPFMMSRPTLVRIMFILNGCILFRLNTVWTLLLIMDQILFFLYLWLSFFVNKAAYEEYGYRILI